jgi:hypothetical protein
LRDARDISPRLGAIEPEARGSIGPVPLLLVGLAAERAVPLFDDEGRRVRA